MVNLLFMLIRFIFRSDAFCGKMCIKPRLIPQFARSRYLQMKSPMQLECRTKADELRVGNSDAIHVTVVKVNTPRAVTIVLRRRPITVGKPFVSIITCRNS